MDFRMKIVIAMLGTSNNPPPGLLEELSEKPNVGLYLA